MSSIRIHLASPPDREHLVAEILVENEQLAEIDQEAGSGALQLELYPRRDGRPWRMELDVLLRALAEARARLTGR